MTKRPGRKRRFGYRSASGHSSGHLQNEQHHIGPTPEVLLRRIMLAGPSGDVTKSSSVIDLLHTHNIIGEDEVRAARWFCRLFLIRFGYPHPKGTLGQDGTRTSGGGAFHETRIDREASRDYATAIAGIKTYDRGMLIEVAVFDLAPDKKTWPPTRRALSVLTKNYLENDSNLRRVFPYKMQ